MKEVHNIFSSGKVKPVPRVPIIVDTRESSSLVVAALNEKNALTRFEKLDVADYLIGSLAIERKTFSDFVSSMINKRLVDQLKNLKKYEKHFLLLEGFNYNYKKFGVHENAIRGMLLSVATDFQIPMIFTRDEDDSANFLITLAKKFEKQTFSSSSRIKKDIKSLDEEKQFVLEGFSGIGPIIAKRLLDEHKTLKKIFSLDNKDLQKIEKFSVEKIEKFRKLLEE